MPDDEPGLVEPGLEDPGLEDPVFGFELPGAPGVPGRVPHGEPFMFVPGVVFGFIVDGCVVFDGVGGFGEFDPGTVDGVGDGVVGVAELPGGVAVPGA